MQENLAVKENHHHQQVPSERRTNRRIKVELSVSFPGGKGLTRNISVGGVYFETDCVDVFFSREEIPVEIHFVLDGPGGKVLYITTVMRVERLEKNTAEKDKAAPPMWGVALAFKESKTSLSLPPFA